MANERVRRIIGGLGLKQWEAAEILKISESYFSRKLRKELDIDEQNEMIEIIEAACASKEVC